MEAITNPLEFVPLRKRSRRIWDQSSPQYILTLDEQGNLIYTLLQTLKEETG
ncbi:hypothetical protein KAI60_01665 [Candidatus Bathyarchaeota archaeon]|nr:hypothetical protein [Candidatus Bathyarchaeota archaeon]